MNPDESIFQGSRWIVSSSRLLQDADGIAPKKKKTLPSSQKQWRRLADGSEGHIEVHAAGMVSISNLQGRLYAKSDANTSWNPTRDVWGHGNSSTLHVEEIKNKF